MNLAIKVKLAIFTIFLVTYSAFSQKDQNSIEFSQQNLNAYKIDKDIYNFFWHKNNSYYNSTFQKRNFIEADTLPYFADYKTWYLGNSQKTATQQS